MVISSLLSLDKPKKTKKIEFLYEVDPITLSEKELDFSSAKNARTRKPDSEVPLCEKDYITNLYTEISNVKGGALSFGNFLCMD